MISKSKWTRRGTVYGCYEALMGVPIAACKCQVCAYRIRFSSYSWHQSVDWCSGVTPRGSAMIDGEGRGSPPHPHLKCLLCFLSCPLSGSSRSSSVLWSLMSRYTINFLQSKGKCCAMHARLPLFTAFIYILQSMGSWFCHHPGKAPHEC